MTVVSKPSRFVLCACLAALWLPLGEGFIKPTPAQAGPVAWWYRHAVRWDVRRDLGRARYWLRWDVRNARREAFRVRRDVYWLRHHP
jgi:hypothetical protein